MGNKNLFIDLIQTTNLFIFVFMYVGLDHSCLFSTPYSVAHSRLLNLPRAACQCQCQNNNWLWTQVYDVNYTGRLPIVSTADCTQANIIIFYAPPFGADFRVWQMLLVTFQWGQAPRHNETEIEISLASRRGGGGRETDPNRHPLRGWGTWDRVRARSRSKVNEANPFDMAD